MNGTSAWIFMAVSVALVSAFSASLYWASESGKVRGPRGQVLALVLLVPLAVGVLYAVRGEPRALSLPPQAAHDVKDMGMAVQRLAERLREHPEDTDGWLMLARSYTMLGRYADAAAAYEHAAQRVMDDSDLLVNWIELRLMASDRQFDARTHELVERAATLAPDDPDVLLLRVLAAKDRGDKASTADLMRALREHYSEGTPDREALDAALEKMGPGK